MAKRKKDDEYRTFQDEWTEEFAFVERAGSAVCLICNDKIASMKRSNVKRHFDTRHATFASKYPAGDSRKKACQELLSRVQATQQHLRVWTRQGDYNSASFAGSLAIVRNGKPFTDGEYAKTFMLDVANELFDDLPNKDKIIKRIQDMPLSARTVHDRTVMMATQVEETQVKDINAAPFFSLALDESTDVSHLSQFSVIARYAAGDTLREESLAVLPIKGSTRGRLLHFEKLRQFKDACTASEPTKNFDLKQLAGFTSSLLQSFKARFGEFREHTRLFKFITHPNECSLNADDLSYIPAVSVRDFEAEVADLKASDMWVNKFKSLNEDLERIARQKAELASKHMWTEMKKLQPEDQLIIQTWNALPVTYDTLKRVSIAVLTMFGSMYSCEQSFSHLKNIKSNLRSRLTDESLNACMKLNLTKYQPDYKAISKSMQHQKSH
ncbi:general transcription factor II-I repeat domain-containing protein 2-like [Xyrichtys novacula]|uniref:General transcription factor II-I repeat domain-containing protein 2-like n=1 Tax=Xyrichtys novacula TaxID=13765 RepID=A0AAV1GYL8_XYRNO|nr:general transcription factor II-I repeat domain-containing protein 2-like [Xyrichtys novacula]